MNAALPKEQRMSLINLVKERAWAPLEQALASLPAESAGLPAGQLEIGAAPSRPVNLLEAAAAMGKWAIAEELARQGCPDPSGLAMALACADPASSRLDASGRPSNPAARALADIQPRSPFSPTQSLREIQRRLPAAPWGQAPSSMGIAILTGNEGALRSCLDWALDLRAGHAQDHLADFQAQEAKALAWRNFYAAESDIARCPDERAKQGLQAKLPGMQALLRDFELRLEQRRPSSTYLNLEGAHEPEGMARSLAKAKAELLRLMASAAKHAEPAPAPTSNKATRR